MTREEAIEKLKAILAEATEDEDAVCYVTSDDADALDMAIKALETPPNDNWEGYSSRLWKAAYERGKVDAEQRWIPVSERLPGDIKPVIVTWKNNDPKSYYQYIVGKHFIGTAHFKNGKWFWYSSVTEDLLAEYGKCDSEEFDEAIEVIAWMPLPEPYRVESDVPDISVGKLDGNPVDIDKAVERYEGTLETLKDIDLEDNV